MCFRIALVEMRRCLLVGWLDLGGVEKLDELDLLVEGLLQLIAGARRAVRVRVRVRVQNQHKSSLHDRLQLPKSSPVGLRHR